MFRRRSAEVRIEWYASIYYKFGNDDLKPTTMILRPTAPALQRSAHIEDAWATIERTQSVRCSECWMITQPAHSALAGEIAAQLAPEAFGPISDDVVRAIALHDAGWSAADAAAIHASRNGGAMPESFITVSAAQTVAAWTGSVETALKLSALGGYLVSSHFSRIARANNRLGPAAASFAAAEEKRRAALLPKLKLPPASLERLVDAVQFCDLLSLYICCGLSTAVEFPQTLSGRKMRAEPLDEHELAFSPTPFAKRAVFQVEALRHPRRAAENIATFNMACG